MAHNMAILMVDILNKFLSLREIGGCKWDVELEDKCGDNEDLEKDLKKGPKKERSISNSIMSSKCLFKVDMKHYQFDIDVIVKILF